METTLSLTIPPSSFCSKGAEISFKQDHTLLRSTLSRKELKEFLKLYEAAQENPKATLPLLLAFSQAHPDHPVVSNLLTFVYVRLRKVGKAHKLIEATYHNHPDYFLAKLNYADLLLRRKRHKEIPALFDGTLDLSLLYPNKRVFHYSEFRAFVVAMGFYHHAIRDKPLAEEGYRLAVLSDPHHTSVLALEKKIFHRSLIRRLVPNLKNFQKIYAQIFHFRLSAELDDTLNKLSKASAPPKWKRWVKFLKIFKVGY